MRILSSDSNEKFYLNEYYYRKLGLIKIKNKIYDINKLPNNLTVKGDLDLSDTKITKLPKNLTVVGSLDLSDTSIKELPEGLTVNDDMNIYNTRITELPQDLKIGGVIDGFEGNQDAYPEFMFISFFN